MFLVSNANLEVIGTALKTLTRELTTLGIHTPYMPQPVPEAQPEFTPVEPNVPTYPQMELQPSVQFPQEQLQPSVFGNAPMQGYEITPELFEAVSSLEPLSIQIGALDESKPYESGFQGVMRL
jgi:hypothetical protein